MVGLHTAKTGRQRPTIQIIRPGRFVQAVPVLRVEVPVDFRIVLNKQVCRDVACWRPALRFDRVVIEVFILTSRATAPVVVRAIVVGVYPAVVGHLDVVGVPVAGRVDLHRPVGEQLGAVQTIVAAERITLQAFAGGIVQCWHVVDVDATIINFQTVGSFNRADLVQIDLKQRGGVRGLLLACEVVGRCAGVGVATTCDDQAL